jgi:hypothetical protein
MRDLVKLGGVFKIRCIAPDGTIKWEDEAKNLVTNEGLDHILGVELAAGTQVTSWYLGLTDGTPTPAAADTLATHTGWTEVTAYTGDRKAFTPGSVSSQSVDNSASKASFAINANSTTVGGAFLASAPTGTTGTLLSVAAFTSGDKVADSGDTVEVQYTFNASSS